MPSLRNTRRPVARKLLRLESLEDRRLLAGLVSWWTADDTAADSVGANHGTLVSGASYAPGHVGQAFSLDGIDDRVQVADSPSLKLTQSLTIEAWLRVDSVSTTQAGEIFFRGDDRGGLDPYKLQINPDGTIVFGITPTSGQGVFLAAPAPIGQFFHVAATLDDATGAMRLYINGVVKTQTTTTIRPFGDLDPTRNPSIGIGNHGGWPATPNNLPFHGLIDELKVYDVALSSAEVLANYAATSGLPQISISDATAIEGGQALKFIDQFVAPDSGGLTRPRVSVFGPDSTGDGVAELYVASADTDEVLRYDGDTGAFLDAFVSQGSGGLDAPLDLEFAPDGNLYVSTHVNQNPEISKVLRYDGATGAFLEEIASGLNGAHGISWHDGALYVTTYYGNEVFKYDTSGFNVFVPAGSGGLDGARHALFGADANGDATEDLYVASALTRQVLRYDGLSGAFIDVFATMDTPVTCIEFGQDGDLYVGAIRQGGGPSDITRFDTATRQILDVFSTGQVGLSVTADAQDILYSSNTHDRSVHRYGPSSLAAFTVSLSTPSATPITVNFETQNGSAVAGNDYHPTTGTLTFAAGQTSRTILIKMLDDAIPEPNETFFLNLSNPVGAAIADGLGVGTIENNLRLAGDYDSNGTVDAADRDVWRASFGQIVLPGAAADGNANGVVDAADYVIWRKNLGATSIAAAAATDAPPSMMSGEPAALGRLALVPQRVANRPPAADATAFVAGIVPAPSTSSISRQATPKPRLIFSDSKLGQSTDGLNFLPGTQLAVAPPITHSGPRTPIDSDDRTIIDAAFAGLDNDRWSELATEVSLAL